ncbi:MAG: transcriptional regulator NrdR [Deltaproteobacteria bacterium]|nr:transcriptional regulator NrdR [Deltaproteobacteria bacterium]MCW5801073.1 transcriptional regulator NrdR [Deltaproteobacteria bacterium]
MQCPYCNGESTVTETRPTADAEGGHAMRRRRHCTVCKRRFTTYERLGAPALKVTKRDGTSEPFDGDKLLRALKRVCAHRPGLRDDDLRRLARDIEATLVDDVLGAGRKSVAWSDIARLVLRRLANVDPVAAQRLAVNYTDESGDVRFEAGAPAATTQLGLPLPPAEGDPET